MTDSQPLALLALCRAYDRIGPPPGPGVEGDSSEGAGRLAPTGGDRAALGRVLRRAIERAWLTLELLFARETVGPRLGRGGPQTLAAVFGSRCFDRLIAVPEQLRDSTRGELHAARTVGPLRHSEIDVDALLGQVAGLGEPGEARVTPGLEWYALGQMAAGLVRDGYPGLKFLIEARTATGDSLLVGLVASFLTHELEVEGHPPHASPEADLLPPDQVRWLCEHSEPVEVLLNEGGGSLGRPARSGHAEDTGRVRRGLAYAQRGEYERAVVEFAAAIQADPTAPLPHVYRGDAHRVRGEYDRAVADYTQALRLDPNNLLGYLNRGLVYRLLGRTEAAVADLNAALRVDPGNVVALNARGAAHADLGRFDEAVADHTRALRLDPSLAWAYQSRGDAYAGRGEYDRAITDYTQALRLNPHLLVALANRGDAYRLSGAYDRAAADYTEALRLDPLNPRMLTSRGDARRREGQFALALADYGEAIRLDPTNPTAYLNRGIAYQGAGEYDRAVADFNRAEQFDSANAAVYYQRALAYQGQRSYEQALADLGRAIELNPRDAVAYLGRGSLHVRSRSFDLAVADFTEAIRLDPTSAQARLERGRVHAQLNNTADALADCDAALALDPSLVPALLVRGGVLLRENEYAAARAEYDRAVGVNPRYAKAFNDRGVAHSKLGQLDRAVEDFTQALDLRPDYVQALANRANAYQLLGRHAEAVRDSSRAVVLDGKYAASFCVQRGLAEAARGNARIALAEYAVALVIDPGNRAARSAWDETLAAAESEFEVTLPPEDGFVAGEAVRAAAAETGRVSAAVTQPNLAPLLTTEATVPVAPTTEAGAGPPAEATDEPRWEEVGETAAAPEGADGPPDEEPGEKAPAPRSAEVERLRLEILAQQAAEVRKKQEKEEAAKKKAAGKKARKRQPEDDPDEDPSERWRRRKQYAILAVAAVFLLYWSAQGVWALIPQAPPSERAVSEFLGAYAKDARAADKSFANQVLYLKGKITLVGEKNSRGRYASPPKVYMTAQGVSDDLKVELQFADPDEASALKTDTEGRAVGRVQAYSSGKPIVLADASFR